ncbi:hypothetical protein TNCT_524991 [Trichonephila clavata]|uniref:Uncharacterized protein n=1 Tax=Trichonephila clavata TaxID=2740835 RepID=A0A8X6GKB9_TRICU|nr:hypothetical protein TNCT_524991 [Trichonephila clavata]
MCCYGTWITCARRGAFIRAFLSVPNKFLPGRSLFVYARMDPPDGLCLGKKEEMVRNMDHIVSLLMPVQ